MKQAFGLFVDEWCCGPVVCVMLPALSGVTMSELIEGDYGIADVVGLLWFKRKLPKYATKFMEM